MSACDGPHRSKLFRQQGCHKTDAAVLGAVARIPHVHEGPRRLLLCVKVTHKVLRLYTVHQFINQIKVKLHCAVDRIALPVTVNAELKDSIVMTMYNRKPYHVDDIDFQLSQKGTFETSKGTKTYADADYYKTRYGLESKDMNQPLQLSKPRKMDILDDKPVYLIPELCQSTQSTSIHPAWRMTCEQTSISLSPSAFLNSSIKCFQQPVTIGKRSNSMKMTSRKCLSCLLCLIFWLIKYEVLIYWDAQSRFHWPLELHWIIKLAIIINIFHLIFQVII